MQIIVKQVIPITVELDFSDEELQNLLFSPTYDKMSSTEGYTVNEIEQSVTIEVESNDENELGKVVDDLRELWCGDVVFEYDNHGNPLPKDLSNCPCFKIGNI
jgi:hypothetical protein